MADNSDRFKVLKLPIWAAGFVVLCLVLSRSARDVTPPARQVIEPQAEARLIQEGVERANAELAVGKHSIAQVERNIRLRLKLEDTPERKLEVAGGLFEVASTHLDQGDASEAMRIAQLAADLAPGSVLAAHCWFLCGQASAVTSPDLPLSIRYFERANAALVERQKQYSNEAEALQLRARVLQRLGQTEARFSRNEEAIEHFRELTGTTDVAQAQAPADRLRAMVSLSQQLLRTGRTAESDQWAAEAEKYAASDAVPSAEALHALAELARFKASHPAAPSMEALQRLWETQRFELLPEWFQIGDELASEYYFHEPPQLADFELVVGKLLKQLAPVIDTLPPETTQRAELESLYATNLLLAAEAARNRSDQAEVSRLVQLFETKFRGRDVSFISPLARPAQRLHRVTEIYRTTMTGHAEQLRKIRMSENSSPRL